MILCVLSAILISVAALRRDFLGDGLRHLPAVLAAHPSFGEPRWLLFPALAWTWVRALSAVGVVSGAESAIQALLWMCVASGVVFLSSIRSWLVLENANASRRAAALLLAGSCAPVLILFSDIAEPQIAAAIVASGLAYARAHRDDPTRARKGAFMAIAAIALATLIYQGAILALGMLPLAVSWKTIRTRRVYAAAAGSVGVVVVVLIGAQLAAGTAPRPAVTAIVGGERNPRTRSLMARASPAKYLVAIVAGPPQGIAALENFSGVPSLLSAMKNDDGHARQQAILNASRLALGCVVVGILLASGLRAASWGVLGALAVLLVLPVLRNQQYGYPKFFILWPIPVAFLALRPPPQPQNHTEEHSVISTPTIVVAAIVVLLSNLWIVADDVRRGRAVFAAVHADYARATPSTCWFTSGWSPPVSYLWPGTTVPVLGILATGSDPAVQASTLTASLRRCFCESAAVWTDTSSRDADVVGSLARHFDYTAIDLTSVLGEPSELEHLSIPDAGIYSGQGQQRACSRTRGLPR